MDDEQFKKDDDDDKYVYNEEWDVYFLRGHEPKPEKKPEKSELEIYMDKCEAAERARVKALQKVWREKNKEKQKEKQKLWREKNKDKIKTRKAAREFYKKNGFNIVYLYP